MDTPVPFGHEQTIPTDRMVSLLASLVPDGGKVMEIGVGSGTLARALASKCQEVLGVDVQPMPDGQTLPSNVTLVSADGCTFDSGEEFDAIVVSFAAKEIYSAWKKQLRIGGRLIVPLKVGLSCSIRVFDKDQRGELWLTAVPAYASFTNEVHTPIS